MMLYLKLKKKDDQNWEKNARNPEALICLCMSVKDMGSVKFYL